MNTPIYYDDEDLTFIKANCQDFTIPEMAIELAIPKTVLENLRSRLKLNFKAAERVNFGTKPKKWIHDKPKEKEEAKVVTFIRPKGEYSNKSAMGNQYQ